MHNAHQMSAQDGINYITSGKGTFTIVGNSTRYTFKAGQSKDDQGNLSPVFIKVLTGPDNTSDYQYIGFLRLNDILNLQAGRKGNQQHPAFKALWWVLQAALRGKWDALQQVEFWHEGTCGRCGRALTVPESIERGLGPKCAGLHS